MNRRDLMKGIMAAPLTALTPDEAKKVEFKHQELAVIYTRSNSGKGVSAPYPCSAGAFVRKPYDYG